MKHTDVLLLGCDFNADNSLNCIVVGVKNFKGEPDPINLFTGEEAENLYRYLVGKGAIPNGM